jgi:spore coat protein A
MVAATAWLRATPPLIPFVDPLPLPRVLTGTPDRHGLLHLDLTEVQTKHRFHRDLPPTTVWAYDGDVPGPTIEVVRGRALAVRWRNRLPGKPLLPVSQPPPMQGDCGLLPEARTTVHLHGAYVREGNFMDSSRNNDGYPDGWILPGQSQAAFYPNQQPAACLWYHDHALGCTARNVAAGLAGVYLIRDPAQADLGLPSGRQELPLVLQARSFRVDGSMDWPSKASSEEVYGDVATVNGKIWPYFKVQARRYRFHLLNDSTSRIFDLRFSGPAGPTPALWLVGGDGGLFEHPVALGGSGTGPG